MSRPDDISRELWDEAVRILDAAGDASNIIIRDIGGAEVIARAIMAAKAEEREDIWAIASGNAVGERELERMAREASDAEGALIHAFLARENEQLAAAIRKRGEG